MDKLRSKDVESLLGIYPPFFIKEMKIDIDNETCQIEIGEEQNKSKLSIRSRFRDDPAAKTLRWQHSRFGRFSTEIEFKTTESAFARITQTVFPGFFGKIGATHTVQVTDAVLLGHAKKLDAKTISELTGTNEESVKQIIFSAENEKLDNQASSLLPLETDPIWIKIIKREISLKTKSNPLRMLLHKLELTELNGQGESTLQESVSTLRAFFIKNKSRLKNEYIQIGAKNVTAEPAATKQRALKPDHPVWDSILAGDVSIISSNLAFNLYITRLKDLYSVNLSALEKREIIIDLMKYLKKNMSNLRAELVSIKRLSQTLDTKNNAAEIPEADNAIWTDIIDDKLRLTSNKINLSLLLVKLKSQKGQNTQAESAAELHKFFTENQRTLKAELEQINQRARQAV